MKTDYYEILLKTFLLTLSMALSLLCFSTTQIDIKYYFKFRNKRC